MMDPNLERAGCGHGTSCWLCSRQHCCCNSSDQCHQPRCCSSGQLTPQKPRQPMHYGLWHCWGCNWRTGAAACWPCPKAWVPRGNTPSKPSSRRLICTGFGAPPAAGRGPVATCAVTLRWTTGPRVGRPCTALLCCFAALPATRPRVPDPRSMFAYSNTK